MSSDKIFTDNDAWTGGFYELGIEVGGRDDARLEVALKAIWQARVLEGCWLDRTTEPVSSSRVAPNFSSAKEGHLYGIATLPNFTRVGCATCVVREELLDWLNFYIPMGALETAYPARGFPFGSADSTQWRQELDHWFVELARKVFTAVPYKLALIGHEISGEAYSDEISKNGLPSERWIGYLCETQGRLEWHPPSKYEAPFDFTQE